MSIRKQRRVTFVDPLRSETEFIPVAGAKPVLFRKSDEDRESPSCRSKVLMIDDHLAELLKQDSAWEVEEVSEAPAATAAEASAPAAVEESSPVETTNRRRRPIAPEEG